MAADLDERIESVDVSKIELDGKIGKDLSVGGGGDCNGNAHKQEGKDDGDGSYVFVNGSDMVADDPVAKDLDVTDREIVELEENVNSPIEEKPVEVDKSNVNGEGSKIDESEVEKNDAKLESHAIENGNQEPLISSVEAEAVESEPCRAVNEQVAAETHATVVVEADESKLEKGDHECLITPAEVESELSGSGNEQLVEEDHKLEAALETEVTVAGVAAKSNLEEGDQECLIPPAEVESELSGSGNEQMVEEDHKLEAASEAEGRKPEVTVACVAADSNLDDQGCLIARTKVVEPELSGSGNEQVVEEDHKLETASETEGQETEVTVAGVVAESNLEEGDQECLIPPAEVESELSGSGNEQVVEEDHKLEAASETEGQETEVTVAGAVAESNLEGGDQGCLFTRTKAVESELSGSGNEQVVEVDHKLEGASEIEGQEAEVTVTGVAVESKLEGGDQECLITRTKAVESELSGSGDEQVVELKLEAPSETEVTVASEATESKLEDGDQVIRAEAVGSDLSGSGNDQVVEEEQKLEAPSEIEVTFAGEATTDSKLDGGDQVIHAEAVESDLSGSGNEQAVEAEKKLGDSTKVEEIDSEITKAAESKLEDGNKEPPIISSEAVLPKLSECGNERVVEEKKLEAATEVEHETEETVDEAAKSKLEDSNQGHLITSSEAIKSEMSGSCNEEVVEKEKNLEATTELEEQETEIITVPESKLDQLNNEEENVEKQIKSDLDTDVKEDLDCSQTEVPDVTVPELNQVDNGEEKVEEQIKSDSITDAKDNLDCSHTEDPDVVVSELNQVANGEEKVEEQTISDSAADVKDNLDCSQSEIHDVVSEIHELDNGDEDRKEQLNSDCSQSEVPDVVSGVQQPDNEEKKAEEASNADVAEDSQLAVEEISEVELVQVNDADEKVEEQKKLDSSAEDQVDQDSHMTVTESVVTELQGETVRLGNGVPTDEPSEPLQADQKLNEEIVTCPSDDMQVEAEDSNAKSESIESLPTCPVGQSISETELNDSVEGGESIIFPVEETVSETEVNNSAGEVKSMSTCPKDEIQTEPKNDSESVGTESLAPSAVDMKSKTELEAVSIEIGESLPVDHAESASLRSVSSGRWADMCADDNVHSEGVNGTNEKDHRVPDIPIEEVGIQSEANLDSGPVDAQLDIPVDDVKINSDSASDCGNLDNGLVDDVQLEPEAGTRSVAIKEEMSNANVNIRSMPAIVNEVIDVANEEVQQISDDNGTPIHEEVVAIEGTESNGSVLASPEESATDALESQKVEDEVVRRPIRFLIRIPRYVDDTIRDQIGLAQQQVEERTQSRDAIRSTIQSRKVTCSEYRDKFEAARLEERAAREILNVKRQEMDSIQVVINRMKSANSIDDIDDKVHNMEHRIQHETMPLKEEKQLIRDMKQLKTLREQLSSSLSREAEGQPTSDQRDTVEERFKLLKQELESARNVLLRAEAITKAARKIYFDESDKLRELQGQFRAADDLRQESYMRLHNLKKQLYEKNKYFRTYKEDAKKAEDYAFAGDREALQNLCANQVEMVMELWNKNDEFRNEYVRCNKMSILRRFKTLDGRSLGPDEEPPVLRNPLDERFNNNRGSTTANKIISTSVVPNSEQGKSDFPALEPVKSFQKSPKGYVKSVVALEQKTQPAKSKETKSVLLENGSATVSGREEIEEKAKEENKLRKEEEELARKAEELARKAEELRKEEEAAKLKEQRRLEEKAKAKEAEERKRRNAEKAQARALLKAQKEAELKEKEREKKARKKEKKAAAAESPTGGVETESASSSEINPPETTRELEIKEKPKTVGKRPQKASVLAKQTKSKAAALPPPLRNRGKRRMQQWMWIAVAILVVLGLFLLGNNYSFKFGLPSFGF